MPQSFTEAQRYFRAAAEQGQLDAECYLAAMLLDGEGGPPDLAGASQWFRRAAESGSALAQYNLGRMAQQGRVLPRDGVEALKWLRLAADQGRVDAQEVIGEIYFFGEPRVPKDFPKAFQWFSRAADRGNAAAQCNLAHMYEDGLGVERHPQRAFDLFKASALGGDRRGQMNLGRLLFAQQGRRPDLVQADLWLTRSAEQNEIAAVKLQRDVESAMTPAEVAEAHRRAHEQPLKPGVPAVPPAHERTPAVNQPGPN